MPFYEADELRRIADIIDGFPKFIRRDKGKVSVHEAISSILNRHNVYNATLEIELEQLTEGYRQTVANYYERQFGA